MAKKKTEKKRTDPSNRVKTLRNTCNEREKINIGIYIVRVREMYMVSVDEIMVLLREYPEYVKTLKKAIEHEEQNAMNPHYLGWEWYDVETLGAKLQRLVINGIIKVNFKSRSATCYLLKDRKSTRDALKQLEEQ
jgi:hypothetical protein